LIDQRIATAAVRRSNRAIKQQLWASLGPGGAIIDQSGPKSGTGSITSKRISTGRYEVDFKRNVSACSWTATPVLPANLANNPPPTPRTAVTARANGQPTGEVTVYVYEASVLKDSNVAVQVLC
jgi:hypothetical protein